MTERSSRDGVTPWSWLDAADSASCERSLAALQDLGAVAPREVTWLSVALARALGSEPGLSVPAASWSLRLCERVGCPVAGDIAVAVAAVVGGAGVAEAPDALARTALAARVLGRHSGAPRAHEWMLCLGEHAATSPLACASGDGLPPENPALAAELCPPSARDLVALWTTSALVGGDDLAPWARFGEALAGAVALLDGLIRLWLDPAAPHLDGPALTPLFSVWLGERELAAPLLLAFAGERASPIRRREISDLVVTRPYREALAGCARRSLASSAAVLRSIGPSTVSVRAPLAAAGVDFLEMLAERFRFFEGLMAFRALLGAASAPAPSPSSARARGEKAAWTPRWDAERDLDAAVDFLSDSAPWPGSWEVQRFGVLGSKERPVGQWFARSVILLCLLEAGRDVRAEVEALLHEIPAGDLRYYGTWPEVPPDGDLLGIVLQLVAAAGLDIERVASWISIMFLNADDEGILPTWFYRGPRGPTTPGRTWAGNDCTAVRTTLLAGLLAYGRGRFDALIQANTRRVLAASRRGEVRGSFFYDASYAALAFLRFARLYRDKAEGAPLAGDVAQAESAIRGRIESTQRLDGGWGTPQRTAACLEGVAMGAAPRALVIERASRYLGEHQLADGSWPAEPAFLIPLKDDRVGHHRGRALTTALCARSLAVAVAAYPRSVREGSYR